MNLAEKTYEFLNAAGWGAADATPLQADFSSRRYIRLKRDNGKPDCAILMQAAIDQKTPQFIAISNVLRQLDISAPKIYANATLQITNDDDGTNEKIDVVLMEDFGDARFGELIDGKQDASTFFRLATDVLVHLHRRFKPEMLHGLNLPIFNTAMFVSQAELFLDYYFPSVLKRTASCDERAGFQEAWKQVLSPLESLPQTLMLRDYMPDNLMNLPEGNAWHKVGVLDFQDGGLGPLPYDLASLCEEVRRDGGAAIMEEMIVHYHRHNPVVGMAELRRACNILSAQRHTRVLGIITRLAEKPNGKDKLGYLPRILKALRTLLQEEALAPVRGWMEANKVL